MIKQHRNCSNCAVKIHSRLNSIAKRIELSSSLRNARTETHFIVSWKKIWLLRYSQMHLRVCITLAVVAARVCSTVDRVRFGSFLSNDIIAFFSKHLSAILNFNVEKTFRFGFDKKQTNFLAQLAVWLIDFQEVLLFRKHAFIEGWRKFKRCFEFFRIHFRNGAPKKTIFLKF